MKRENELNSKVPIITIDGPSGVGKGTVSMRLAKQLKWHLLDSGAIYRCLAYVVQLHGVALDDEQGIFQVAQNMDIHFGQSSNGQLIIKLADDNISQAIRTDEISVISSKISGFASVRTALLARQRDFARLPGLIADGRDMGTVVFPDASLKLYLHASDDERVKRRYLQLQQKNASIDREQVKKDMLARDQRDSCRKVAPLKPAVDAIVIDTTDLSIDEVLAVILGMMREKSML